MVMLPLEGCTKPIKRLEQRRFASAVHAHQPAEAAGLNLQGDVVERNDAVIVDAEVADADALAGGRFRSKNRFHRINSRQGRPAASFAL